MPNFSAAAVLSSGLVVALSLAGCLARGVRQGLRGDSGQSADRWRAKIDSQLPVWLTTGRCPGRWLRRAEKRQVLLEAMLSSVEQDQSGRGAACQQALLDWGLVGRQEEAVRRSRGWERAQAVALLGRMRQPRTIPLLEELLYDPSRDVCVAAARALGLQARAEAAQALLESFEEVRWRVPVAVLQQALVSCCQPKPEVLRPHLERPDPTAQRILTGVVAEVATPALLPALERFVDSRDPQVRAQAARALGRFSDHAAIALLGRLVCDPVGWVRRRAVQALDQADGWSSVDLLLAVLNSEHADVRMIGAERLAHGLGRKAVSPEEMMPPARERLRAEGWAMLLGSFAQAGSVGTPHAGTLVELLRRPVPALREVAGWWLCVAVGTGADKVLLDALLDSGSASADTVADFLGRNGDAALLADLEDLGRRLPAGSPHQQLVARVRGQIRERLCSALALVGSSSR